jgi:uncharacterized protein (TIGR03663 family)
MKQVSTRKRPTSGEKVRAARNSSRQGSSLLSRLGLPLAAIVPLLLGACVLRLLLLDLKPLHHDEGVNGTFMTNLFRAGFYHYDPANYHGPTLYYFGLITTTLNALFYGKAGLSTFAIRLVPAIFGIGLIWLIFYLRPYLGVFGTLTAATLIAISPGMVFFSRYFIHEIPFVFFTLALVIAALRYRETAEPKYLLWASASAALLFATKETCIITYAVLTLSWICMRLYFAVRKRPPEPPVTGGKQIPEIRNTGKIFQTLPAPIWAALLFLAIWLLFYSSFFTNPNGLLDSLRTFKVWTHTGTQTNTYRAPWYRYIDWLAQEELPILLTGGLGILVALWKASNRFAVFTAFWALGFTAAYSLLPYKTPWLALNLILPLALCSGYLFHEWYATGKRLRTTAILVFLAAGATSLYQTIELNFFRYDDNSLPYVYAHTTRQLLDLVDQLDSIASHNPAGHDIGITIDCDTYWPLPWYLRDYPRAGFWGHIVQTSEPIVIACSTQTDEVEKQLGPLYRRYNAYELRPGNLLVLYLRRDVQP